MPEISLTGNRESYQQTRKVNYLEIKLIGDFALYANTPIDFFFDSVHFPFKNGRELFRFSEEIRGASSNHLLLILLKYGLTWPYNKPIEISLLKSLFLIYHWLEHPLGASSDLDLKGSMFNEFIVDWTDQPQSQKDIYLIDERHCIASNEKLIQKLIDLNLLGILTVTVNTPLTSYFIPLVKPGVSRGLFSSALDIKGDSAYSLWQQILHDRNAKISNWVNNRF